MPSPPPSLKGRALRLLSAREYSRTELERRLKSHEDSPGLLTKALDELQAKGFIDEQRVLDSVIHRRSAKLGAARIRQELQNKGLEAEAVKAAISGLQVTEFERAQAIWRKKFGASVDTGDSRPTVSIAERGRQMRFLMSRGFGADTIRRVIAVGSGEQQTTFETLE